VVVRDEDSIFSLPLKGSHGANDLRIGDSVTARFTRFAGRLVPYFEKAQ
jgi:hypothetical protein